MTIDIPEFLNVREHEGWNGAFTRDQAPGAIPSGTRIRKSRMGEGDTHAIGALGTVLGSIAPREPIVFRGAIERYFYFVEWDDHPKMAVGITGSRIEQA